ncbi:unnamed protein product [Ceratitis capitata]|uniref:(Mediterranean fruit fly) hypothetical protein n=1 Tax=Ceratitis capitata TaxID=7213 RepID=A0A811V7I2_CERCA|nr:unnamed protein product [Ceratitis capitata]
MREALRISPPQPLQQQSFGNNGSTGLRMHIINIHKNYKRNDAAAALAFGHFNGEKEVNDLMGQMLCDALEITGSPQRLIMPIMRTMDAKQVHDVFPVIVPNAGRGNPENSSEL